MHGASSRLCLILASVALAASTPLAAEEVELPKRKAGQWDITMAPDAAGAMPVMTMKACVDPASDEEMMRAGLSLSESMCSRQDMSREGDTIVIDSTCKVGPTAATSRVVISGDFQSAYTIKVTTDMAGGADAMAGGNGMTQEARWVGADCTDGMVPGDMLMPGGMKMNGEDMMKMMEGGMPPG